ncbi:hypothetical protein [Bradyrhizobium sp. USDA 4350]
MKILIVNDNGEGVFTFDTVSAKGEVMQAVHSGKTDIANALLDATAFIKSDHSVIASIRADISAVIGRIEHELGAHPAFSWAETKLGHAAEHLEAYVAGLWTEPHWPEGVALNERGMIVPAAEGSITNQRPAGKGVEPVAHPIPSAALPQCCADCVANPDGSYTCKGSPCSGMPTPAPQNSTRPPGPPEPPEPPPLMVG